MLTNEEKQELLFFANKVATVHGPDHKEYIDVNNILQNNQNLSNNDFDNLRSLTSNYTIPEGACKAQTTLLSLLAKLDKEQN